MVRRPQRIEEKERSYVPSYNCEILYTSETNYLLSTNITTNTTMNLLRKQSHSPRALYQTRLINLFNKNAIRKRKHQHF